ncbi:hypothetical protein EJ04DRAFT_138793 [Polyplosphaeria fusca]|uniref:Uncharacterized protein n=1 Tax=Polyplosphaeria fusca TaxID=682080 RepID=A0A9P4V502_9PLEO|nr:hypothetical protein EJ04DRAFT_138793 [Polyplosphaeria fusca]
MVHFQFPLHRATHKSMGCRFFALATRTRHSTMGFLSLFLVSQTSRCTSASVNRLICCMWYTLRIIPKFMSFLFSVTAAHAFNIQSFRFTLVLRYADRINVNSSRYWIWKAWHCTLQFLVEICCYGFWVHAPPVQLVLFTRTLMMFCMRVMECCFDIFILRVARFVD